MAESAPRPSTDAMASPAFLLSGLGRVVRDEIEGELRRHGLSLRHLSALGHLSRQPDISYSELARRVGVTAQSMQATLRQLEDQGAVERVTSAGRGRTAQLRLTAAGTQRLTHGRQAISDVDGRLFGKLEPTERDELIRLLMRAYSLAAESRVRGRSAIA